MKNTRREFIKRSGTFMMGASVLGMSSHGWAAAARRKAEIQPTLVAIYLRGGADAVNVVVPYADKNYASLRPTIALPGPDSKDANRVLPLDGTFAFNPNLKELHALYGKNLCAPIVCAGSHHPTRSHFQAQDFMERAAPGMSYVTTGWLNRYLLETRSKRDSKLRSFALQPQLPRSFRGKYPVLAKPAKSAEGAMSLFQDFYP